MECRSDEGISDMVATILIIILVVALAAVVGAAFMGLPIFVQKPVLAAFTADVVKGADTTSAHQLTVPVIRFSQMAGDSLTQNYTQNTHSGINETRVKIADPTGKMYNVVQSTTLTGKTITKGQSFYIFRTVLSGETNEYWLTNDGARIFNGPAWGGVQPFSPRGKWRLVITDEKSTNMVLFQKELIL